MEPCERCGTPIVPVHAGPVTVSSWYGSYDVRWNNGKMVRFGPYCDTCKAEDLAAPTGG